MDAVSTYIEQGAIGAEIDPLLARERILFCCYSRLLATLWVRSERGRYDGTSLMPEHLAGSCTTFAEGLEIFLAKRPTLVICTQLLEEGSGLELVAKIKDLEPHLPTLLFLQHRNIQLYQKAVETYSDGIVLEDEMGSGHLTEAIKTITQGGMYLEPAIAQEMHSLHDPRNTSLTDREIEVMQYVVQGLNDREIGEAIHLATDTIKYHLKHIYGKLGIHNRTRAAITLVLMGIVAPPSPLLPKKNVNKHHA